MSSETGEQSLAQRTIRSILWTGGSQYFLFGLGIVKTGVLARWVPVEYFGAVAIAQAWVSYLLFFRTSFQPAILSWDKTQQLIHTHFWIFFALNLSGFGLAGLVYLLLPNILSPLTWTAIALLLSISIVEALAVTPRLLTERDMRQDVIAQLMIVSSLIGLVVPVVVAWQKHYLLAVVLDVTMPILVVGVGVLIYQRWWPRLLFDRTIARRLLSLGGVLWLNSIFSKVIFQFDDWLVGTYTKARPKVWLSSGIEPAAFYWRAYTAGKMPMDVFAGMIGSVAMPLYARSADRGAAVLKDVYHKLTWLLTYMIFFSSTVALIATEEVVTIVLGESWLSTVPLFRLMSLFIIGRPLYQNAAQLLLAIQHEKDLVRSTVIQAIFLMLVCPPAVFFWGAAGAAVAVSVMTALGILITEYYVTLRLDVRIWPVYILPGIIGVLVCGIMFGLNPWLPDNIWLSLSIKGLITTLIFGGVIWWFEREQLLAVINVVRNTISQNKASPKPEETSDEHIL